MKHVKAEAKATLPNAKAESTNGSYGIMSVTAKKLLASLHWSIFQNYPSGFTAIPKKVSSIVNNQEHICYDAGFSTDLKITVSAAALSKDF